MQQKSSPLQVTAQTNNFEWSGATSSLVQQPIDPQAFDVETPQDEEAAADREQEYNDNEERSTIDETVSLASAPPGELGLIKMAKKKAALAEEAKPAKKMPGELGLVAPPEPAGKEAPADAEKQGGAKPEGEKPIPAELGLIPKKAEGGKGDAGDGDANKGNGDAEKAKEAAPKKSTWPIDNFGPGVYAPDGVPYPLQKVSPLGKFNEFTGLLDNPDGTTSFPDGTMVDAPNTWLMTEDNVDIPIDEYKDELTMAEKEQHEREIQNAKNEEKYNEAKRERLN